MNRTARIALAFTFLLLLAACRRSEPTVRPIHTPAPSVTLGPSATPRPTATPSPWPTWQPVVLEKVAVLGKGSADVVVTSPDGRWVAVGGSLGVRLFDATTKEEVAHVPLKEDAGTIRNLRFSPSSQLLLVIDYTNSRLLEVPTLSERFHLDNRGEYTGEFLFSPDETRIALNQGYCSNYHCNSILLVIKTNTGQILHEFVDSFHPYSRYYRALTASPDGRYLASGDWESYGIYLWDLESGTLHAGLQGHLDRATTLAFSPDGRWLASGSQDTTVRLWSVESGQPVQTMKGFSLKINLLAFSADSRQLTVGMADRPAQVHRLPDGALLAEIPQEPAAPTPTPAINLGEFQGSIGLLQFSEDGSLLVVDENSIHIWPLTMDYQPRTVQLAKQAATGDSQISRDGRFIVTKNIGNLQLWRLPEGKLTATWNVSENPLYGKIAISHTGDYLAAEHDGLLDVWDTRSGQVVMRTVPESGDLEYLSFLADGQKIAGVYAKQVKTWDVKRGSLLLDSELTDSCSDYYGTNLTLDGDWLAFMVKPPRSGRQDYCIPAVWDIGQNQLLRLFEKNHIEFYSNRVAAFHPYRDILALSNSKNNVILHIPSGRQLARFGDSEVNKLTFSPDGQLLAASLGKGQIELWRVNEVDALAQLPFPSPTPVILSSPTPSPKPSQSPPPTLPAPPAALTRVTGAIAPGNAARLALNARVGQGTLRSAAWSPDGATIAVAGSQGVALYTADLSVQKQSLAFELTVERLFYRADGTLLAIVPQKEQTEFWDVAANRRLAAIDEGDYALRPDGRQVLVSMEDGWKTIDLDEPGTVQDLPIGKSNGYITWHPQGQQAAENIGAKIRLWDLRRGELITILDTQDRSIFKMRYSPDGHFLAACVTDGTLWIWNLSQPGPPREFQVVVGSYYPFDEYYHWSRDLSYSPDGRTLALTDVVGNIHLLDVDSGEVVRTLPAQAGERLQIAFAPDSRRLLVLDDSGDLRVWDTIDGTQRAALNGYANTFTGLQFDQRGLSAWRGGALWSIYPYSGVISRIADVQGNRLFAASKDGQWLAMGTQNGQQVELWDATTLTPEVVFDNPPEWVVGKHAVWASFSQNGHSLIVSYETGVRTYTIPEGRPISWISEGFSSQALLVHSADGRYALACNYLFPELWDMRNAKPVKDISSIKCYDEHMDTASLKPGSWIVAAGGPLAFQSPFGKLQVSDLETDQVLETLYFYSTLPTALVYSPDGGLLVAGFADGTLRCFETDSYSEVAAFSAHQGRVERLAFSEDGRLLASAGQDGTVAIWGIH